MSRRRMTLVSLLRTLIIRVDTTPEYGTHPEWDSGAGCEEEEGCVSCIITIHESREAPPAILTHLHTTSVFEVTSKHSAKSDGKVKLRNQLTAAGATVGIPIRKVCDTHCRHAVKPLPIRSLLSCYIGLSC